MRCKVKAELTRQCLLEVKDGSAEQAKYVQDGKDLLEEYSLLYAKVVDPDTYEVQPEKLRKDVPWKKVKELKTKETTFTKKFRHATGYFNANDIAECLKGMAELSLDNFKTRVNEKIAEVSIRINAGGQNNIHNSVNSKKNKNAGMSKRKNNKAQKK